MSHTAFLDVLPCILV